MADLFPSWKLLHKRSGAEPRLMNVHKKVDEIMEDILKENLENKSTKNKGIGEFGGEYLVDVLLRLVEDVEHECPITNDHIKVVILDLFIAGSETSAAITIWVLSEMMKNPNIIAKAQKEVRQDFGYAWALARDPESWHDPESFIPERFENSSIDFMGNHFEFIPFGAGRRICPGILFGLFNVKLPLARLVYHFEWELPYGLNPKDHENNEEF
ncbi:hypothetical protein MTR67_026560 [Solanum verrucosum]|uniref:Cytochrome P450 n=1 Tax=Solanum verrucosum TaxID=315347 RepID=A0AAF0TZ89_SOLVR|nr:hypothetical protein MTR67_026560 [Solanum verrucosum]